mmetsp:Transcript_17427/g.35955  ORF Transcript_17427/g.35955 Transcript_17427/m.35955 type:complete len:202 (+) Transcript_17427:272-877(+)
MKGIFIGQAVGSFKDNTHFVIPWARRNVHALGVKPRSIECLTEHDFRSPRFDLYIVLAFVWLVSDIWAVVKDLKCYRDVNSKNIAILSANFVDEDALRCTVSMNGNVGPAPQLAIVPDIERMKGRFAFEGYNIARIGGYYQIQFVGPVNIVRLDHGIDFVTNFNGIRAARTGLYNIQERINRLNNVKPAGSATVWNVRVVF